MLFLDKICFCCKQLPSKVMEHVEKYCFLYLKSFSVSYIIYQYIFSMQLYYLWPYRQIVKVECYCFSSERQVEKMWSSSGRCNTHKVQVWTHLFRKHLWRNRFLTCVSMNPLIINHNPKQRWIVCNIVDGITEG